MLSQFLFCLSLVLIIFFPLLCILISISTSTLLKKYCVTEVLYLTERMILIQKWDLNLRVLPFYFIGTGMPVLFASDFLFFLENPDYSESIFLLTGIILLTVVFLNILIQSIEQGNLFQGIVAQCKKEQKEYLKDNGSILKQFINGSLSMRMFFMSIGIASLILYGILWIDCVTSIF